MSGFYDDLQDDLSGIVQTIASEETSEEELQAVVAQSVMLGGRLLIDIADSLDRIATWAEENSGA